MLRIKVCGLTDPANVQEIALSLPDYMGFIFYPGSERYAGNQPASLFSTIPPGILKTGVFVNAGFSEIIEMMNSYSLDLLQLHGDESPGYCNALKKKGATIIKAFGISPYFNFSMLEEYTEVLRLLFIRHQSPQLWRQRH
jgi:phosphoribosylanthranilate isomerase